MQLLKASTASPNSTLTCLLPRPPQTSTASLNSVASLFERQQKLETELNSKQAAGAGGREEASEKRERQHLVQLVKIQAKEVEALKLEIKMLRRKGGHVYSAPVPT